MTKYTLNTFLFFLTINLLSSQNFENYNFVIDSLEKKVDSLNLLNNELTFKIDTLNDKIKNLDKQIFLNNNRFFDSVFSKNLKEKRLVNIQLPKSYDKKSKKRYPLMIVLDGDYLFNNVAGSVDYLSYWGDIPENLVVGINQKDTRFQDSSVFDNITHTPITSTALFYDFIVDEIIPFFSKKYKISNFITVVGHEMTANFANFFLLKNDPQIRVISISPKISENMNRYLYENLSKTNSKIVYTVSSSEKDFESILKNVSG